MVDWVKGYWEFAGKNISEIIVTLIVGCILGVVVGYFLKSIIKDGIQSVVRKLDNVVLLFSLLVAAVCMVAALIYQEPRVSVNILSFYSSFIFAWLLTKKSAKEEFKKTQHKVAKNTYRHIEDVETAAIITRDRLQQCQEKLKNDSTYMIDIEGLIDNVDVILTGIRSNKKDWEDMLKKSYREKIRNEEDPEAKLAHVRKKKDIKPPEKDALRQAFCESEQQA